MTKHTDATTAVAEMPIPDLESRVSKVRSFVAQAFELLPGLVQISVDERRHSNGRLGPGEAQAMRSMLVAAGKHPDAFVGLADKDGGKDPKKFEAQPAVDDLDRIAALQDLANEVETLSQRLSDTLLVLGADVRGIGAPVHAIIKANQLLLPALATEAAAGLEFYAARGRLAARTRAAAKEAAAAKADGASK